jgi:hypothetical protein
MARNAARGEASTRRDRVTSGRGCRVVQFQRQKTSSYRDIHGLNVPDYGGKITKETLTHVGIA